MPKRQRAATKRLQFTQKNIEKIPIPKKGRVTVYDATVKELGLRVEANGRRSFFWFKFANTKPVFRALGSYPATLIDQARINARELQGTLEKWRQDNYEGENPFAEPDRGITLQACVDRYIGKQVRGYAARPEKAEADVRWMVNKYLAGWKKGKKDGERDPHLADWTVRPLGRITDRDVAERHHYLAEKHGKVTADRVVQLVRRLYQWGIDKEKPPLWSGLNPARKGTVAYYGHIPRERVLAAEETGRFFAALRDEPNGDLRDFVWLALSTSARRGDILSMRWTDIQDGIWHVPYPKGGRKRAYNQALIAEAIEILNERRARIPQDSTWVFPSAKSGHLKDVKPSAKSGHLKDVKRAWSILLARASVKDFRVHDLRHALPSVQVRMGVSLPVIGRGLGHRPGSPATAVYANLDLKPSNDAMAAAMSKLKADAEAAIKAAQKKARKAAKLLPAANTR